ncbi:hypothetical protein [Kitasatospora brasiliensis]|uniref:hypothetical protein n=1 Tax=Kitasatospora brasiliensis TaxID=3058040 RepID=UPI00292CC4B4|nr:hypothetical protein [Kitasatospora sp. K002]
MRMHFIGADPLGGPAMVWVDLDTGGIIIKGLKALPEDLRAVPPPGSEALELPDRMKPILLEAAEFSASLGLDRD